jgi:branched-chain amino acid transport system permease protein
MEYFILGLALGGAYALVAIGIVVVYSVVRAFQLAHGALVMLFAYVFLILFNEVDDSIFVAGAGLVVVACVVSLVVSRVAFEPLLGKHFPSLVTSLGLAIIIEEAARLYFYDGQAVSYPAELKLDGTVTVLGATVDADRILALVVALIALVLIDLFLRRTRTGMQMRALADEPSGAALCGTNVVRSIRIGFVVAGLSAALAGVLLGVQLSTISPELGANLLIKGVAAALLAGATSLRGAVLAAFLIAISESLAVGYISSTFSEVIAFGVILAMLIVRPQGLFGFQETARA